MSWPNVQPCTARVSLVMMPRETSNMKLVRLRTRPIEPDSLTDHRSTTFPSYISPSLPRSVLALDPITKPGHRVQTSRPDNFSTFPPYSVAMSLQMTKGVALFRQPSSPTSRSRTAVLWEPVIYQDIISILVFEDSNGPTLERTNFGWDEGTNFDRLWLEKFNERGC